MTALLGNVVGQVKAAVLSSKEAIAKLRDGVLGCTPKNRRDAREGVHDPAPAAAPPASADEQEERARVEAELRAYTIAAADGGSEWAEVKKPVPRVLNVKGKLNVTVGHEMTEDLCDALWVVDEAGEILGYSLKSSELVMDMPTSTFTAYEHFNERGTFATEPTEPSKLEEPAEVTLTDVVEADDPGLKIAGVAGSLLAVMDLNDTMVFPFLADFFMARDVSQGAVGAAFAALSVGMTIFALAMPSIMPRVGGPSRTLGAGLALFALCRFATAALPLVGTGTPLLLASLAVFFCQGCV